MNKILEKVLKGLALAAVFGGLCYLISKNIEMSGLIALVMFLSMFAQPKEQKVEKVLKHTKQSKKFKK